ncbi:MAG: hypothetical protein EOP84_28995, partial [Verrucomicrobiaceae bacterium]
MIIRSDVEVPNDLKSILPLIDEGGVSTTGGVQLSRGIWHTLQPPEVRLLSSSSPCTIRVTRANSDDDKILIERASQSKSSAILPAELSGQGDGEYGLQASSDERPVGELTIILRSADRPRPLNRLGRGRLSYQSIYTASSVADARVAVEGMIVRGDPTPLDLSAIGSAWNARVLAEGDGEQGYHLELSTALEQVAVRETCVRRGYHVWNCETLEPGWPRATPLRMQCTGCLQSELTRNRGKTKQPATTILAKPAAGWRHVGVSEARVDYDSLLDALSYLGNDTWGRFEGLLANAELEPWSASAVANSLSVLGFLDLSFKPGSRKIVGWSVPPPAIYLVDELRSYFTGFRSASLCNWIEEAVIGAGGHVVLQKNEGRPTMFEIVGLDFEALRLMVDGIEDQHGRQVELIP